MNGKRRRALDRHVRRAVRAQGRDLLAETYARTLARPLGQRLWLALRIVWGARPDSTRQP
ncbi:MAG TPA: hypothetical protein VK610_04220 [Rhodothermales bacterium]|nr:hypothetical protein [Rhodothermales bacterium]